MNFSATNTAEQNFTFQNVVQAIRYQTDKSVENQQKANAFLESFIQSNELRLDTISALLSSHEQSLQFYGTNLLFRKLINRNQGLNRHETSAIKSLISQVANQTKSNAIVFQSLLKSEAFLVYKDLECNITDFLEQPFQGNFDQIKVSCTVLANLGEFLKQGILHSGKSRAVCSNVKQFAPQILSNLFFAIRLPELELLCLEVIDSFSGVIDWLNYPQLLQLMHSYLAKCVSEQKQNKVEASVRVLSQILSNSNRAEMLKTCTLDTINQQYTSLILHLEGTDIQQLLSQNTTDESSSFVTSLLIVLRIMQDLKTFSRQHFAQLFNSLLLNFPQLMMSETTVSVYLFKCVEESIDFASNQEHVIVWFEWMYPFLKRLCQNSSNVSQPIANEVKKMLYKLTVVVLRLLIFKTEKEAQSLLIFLICRTQCEESVIDFHEKRAQLDDFLSDVSVNWKVLNCQEFYMSIKEIIGEHLRINNDAFSGQLAIESVSFLLTSIMGVLAEDKEGVEIVNRFVQILESMDNQNSLFFNFVISVFFNRVVQNELEDDDLHQRIVNKVVFLLLDSRNESFEHLNLDSLYHLMRDDNSVILNSENAVALVQTFNAKLSNILSNTESTQGGKRCVQDLQTLGTATLKYINRLWNHKSSEASELVALFFTNVCDLMNVIQCSLNKDHTMIVYLALISSILEAYDLERELGEMTDEDTKFTETLCSFLRNTHQLFLDQMNFAFNSEILRPKYRFLVKEMIRKVSDEELPCFDFVLTKFLSSEMNGCELFSTIEELVLMNFENKRNLSILKQQLDNIQLKSLDLLSANNVSKDEDLETDFVSFQSSVLTHLPEDFFASKTALFLIQKIVFYFEEARTMGLKKECARF